MSKTMDIALKQAEQQKEREVNTKLGDRMNSISKDGGLDDGFNNAVLGFVATENYDRAIDEIGKYIQDKAAFPQFKSRVDRYGQHAVDLIHAIRAKRSFPGLNMLAMSKQQDLFDRSMAHFEELKTALKKIESAYHEVRLEDVRSTVWVVKAAVYCGFSLIVLGFLVEVSRGALPSAMTLLDSAFGDITNWAFDKLGL